VHTHDTVIYELHVRGFTARENSGISAARRGTFAGVVDSIPYLTDLGVTTVELMPVTQQDPQGGSYWGYMPLSFFAPESRYSSAPTPEAAIDEFHEMVRALHAANIEVILDIVFNHTAEGDDIGPTYSYKGIDNSTYYLLQKNRRLYRNDTGTGNTLHCANRYVRKLIIDSLHFWLEEMHVDGFRFDLASIFTRNEDGTLNTDDPPVIAEITGLPEASRARLIAEAWDPASNQLGRTFPGISWLQWNGQFRDGVRAYLRGDRGMVSDLMTRLYGSSDLFPDDLLHAYRPYQSVNYVSCHDGLCLNDVVSYDHKHNEANGERNLDGPSEDRSWNCGWEGHPAPNEVLALRKKQVKNFCALLFLSNGTPMIFAGDEFMNTRQGNSNPYNQDNETNWLDWTLLQKNRDVHRFFKCMIAFRKNHKSLGRSHFWREDIRLYGVGDRPNLSSESHSLAFCLHGHSCGDRDIYVMSNACREPLDFRIQEGLPGDWYRVVDTSLVSPLDFLETDQEERLWTLNYRVASRSTVIMLQK
jgi:isoamylase